MVSSNDKARVIIISHPSFLGGKEGIEEAKHFGEMILQMVKSKEMILQVPKAQRAELKKHLAKFQIAIRKIPNALLAK